MEMILKGSWLRWIPILSRTSRRSCVVLIALLEFVGCATTTNVKLPDPAQQTSVIEYVRELRLATATLGDAAVVRMLPASASDYPEYRWWWNTWCPRHEALNNGPELMERIRGFCHVHGGVFQEPVCTDPADPGSVLFFARLDKRDATCGGVATPVGVQLAEPKPGAQKSAAFIEVLHKGGWMSPAERRTAGETQAKKEVAANAAAIAAARAEEERAVRELPLLRTRGTRICHQQGEWIFVAFVEEATDRKIQIRIADARYARDTTSRIRPDGFTPGQIEWDFPDRWHVCE
jgi:hypothetical protein